MLKSKKKLIVIISLIVISWLYSGTSLAKKHIKPFVKSKCSFIFVRSELSIDEKISLAMQSQNKGAMLEAIVANHIKPYIISFEKEVFDKEKNLVIGGIDIETNHFLIEIKGGDPHHINLAQILKIAYHRLMNPNQKPLILFSPKPWTNSLKNLFSSYGIIVINEIDDLIKLITCAEETKTDYKICIDENVV